MKRKNLQFENGFRVVLGNPASQAAEMVLPPGHAEGGPDNLHLGADQWLYVVVRNGHGDREWQTLSPCGRLPHAYRTWGQA